MKKLCISFVPILLLSLLCMVSIQGAPPQNNGEQLMRAAREGNVHTVEQLLLAKVDPNSKNMYGGTALMKAAAAGHMKIVQLLLTAGADLNRQSNRGSTALIWAVQNGHTEIVRQLLTAGADANIKGRFGYTALMDASKGKHREIVPLLLKYGAQLPTEEQEKELSPDALALIESKAHVFRERADAVQKYLKSRKVPLDLVRLIQ